MSVGSYEPQLFLTAIGSRIKSSGGAQNEPELNPIEHSLALGAISSLVKKVKKNQIFFNWLVAPRSIIVFVAAVS